MSNDLDLSEDEANPANDPVYKDRNYNPRRLEDMARRHIAYSLIILLTLVVVLIFILLYRGIIISDEINKFNGIYNPIIALVSGATGFYYGAKSVERAKE